MSVPVEVSYREVLKTRRIEQQIARGAVRLQRVCRHLTSLRIAVERPHRSRGGVNPYRVRIDVRVPPGHEVVVSRDAGREDVHTPLRAVLKDAFEMAERRLKGLVERQRGEVKTHPGQEASALVEKLFPAEGYGFLKDIEGREIYFHRNAVVNEDFDLLGVGAAVRFVAELGEKGPQATTVLLVDKRSSSP
jgi:cold shock CspA family protein